MSLGPEELKRIEAGDRMRVSGEVQVSTTCVARGPRCVGRRYEFNPTVSARIVLAAAPEPGAESIPLSEAEQVLCKQRRPNRNHHCTLAFPNLETAVADPDALPCPANACYVNMLLGASNRNASRGNRVVLGADLPDGGVKGDKGRLNVVQARGEVPPPAGQSTLELVSDALPLTEGKKRSSAASSTRSRSPRRPRARCSPSTAATRRRSGSCAFNTFISSRVILAETPTATESQRAGRSAVALRGDATEANGFNCTQGPSGFASPCTSVKAGAIRITKDAVDSIGPAGDPVPELVGSAKPLLVDERVKRSQRIELGVSSGLALARYTPGT